MYVLSNIQNVRNKYNTPAQHSTIYNFHCDYHLGDSVFNILWLNKWASGKVICYYAASEYLNQLREFIQVPSIILRPIEQKPPFSISLWIGDPYIKKQIFTNNNSSSSMNPMPFNIYLANFYNIYQKNMKLTQLPLMTSFFYTDRSLLHTYDSLHPKYKNCDILVINSVPRSGQFTYNAAEWDSFIIQTAMSGLNVIYTTSSSVVSTAVSKMSGTRCSCTMDDKLTLKQLAAISTRSKVIVAVNSGVMPGILNTYTLEYVKRVYIFDNVWQYNYSKFQNMKSPLDIKLLGVMRFRQRPYPYPYQYRQ